MVPDDLEDDPSLEEETTEEDIVEEEEVEEEGEETEDESSEEDRIETDEEIIEQNYDISACLNENAANYYRYTPYQDCDGSTIPATYIENPGQANFIDCGCPDCNLVISIEYSNPTTFGGTDGSIVLGVIGTDNDPASSTFGDPIATGTANYTYVIEPVNNEDAGKGAGSTIGSGAVSNTKFTFGYSVNLEQTGAVGNPTYATSSLKGYVPAVSTSGTSTKGLEAGTYNVYVFDSNSTASCLARKQITLINPKVIAGCTDNDAGTNDGAALNYSANATLENNSCVYCKASTGELVDYQSNPYNGDGSIIDTFNNTVAPATDSNNTDGEIVFSATPTTLFQGFIEDVIDSNGIVNAQYKLELYSLTEAQYDSESISGASQLGTTVTNTHTGNRFNYVFNSINGYNVTYGRYAVKIYITDPDATVEIEGCYELVFITVPVLVCVDNGVATTNDNVVITDPELYQHEQIICQTVNNYCCQSPILTLETPQGTCGDHNLTVNITCDPGMVGGTLELRYRDNGVWIGAGSTIQIPNGGPYTSWTNTWSNAILSQYGDGKYKVRLVSYYNNSNNCTKMSNVVDINFPTHGCTDATASNYDPLATCDDGSCYTNVLGCTDPLASNYNPLANIDDGSCISVILGCTDPLATNYNASANTNDGSCTYSGTGGTTGTGGTGGTTTSGGGTVTGTTGTNTNEGTPQQTCHGSSYPYNITNNDIVTVSWTDATGTCTAANSDGQATVSVTLNTQAPNWDIRYKYPDGTFTTWSNVYTSSPFSADPITGLAPGPYIAEVRNMFTQCITQKTFAIGVHSSECGCTDPAASNYSASAITDDGSCLYEGCTDPNANNYLPNATIDDGSCEYIIEPYPCIPANIDDMISRVVSCVYTQGSNFYKQLVIGRADDCSIMNAWKIILIDYLINRIGLDCVYNCADSQTISADDLKTCSDIWTTGGPVTGVNDTAQANTSIATGQGTTIDTPGLFFVTGVYLYYGDVIKMPSGHIWILNGSGLSASQSQGAPIDMSLGNPETPLANKYKYWNHCAPDMVSRSFTDSTNYLDNFSTFVNKFCVGCEQTFELSVEFPPDTPPINGGGSGGGGGQGCQTPGHAMQDSLTVCGSCPAGSTWDPQDMRCESNTGDTGGYYICWDCQWQNRRGNQSRYTNYL